MASPISTGDIARWSARRPWLVVAAWLVGLLGISVLSFGMGGNFTTDIEFTRDEEAQVAKDQLEAVRGKEPLFEQVIVQSSDRTVDDPAYRAFVTELTAELRKHGDDIEFTTNFYESNDAALVSADRKTTLLPTKLRGDVDTVAEHIDPFMETLHARDGKDGFTVLTAGFASVNETFSKMAESDLQVEFKALPFALIVLVIVFGAVVAALVPVVLAFMAIFLATALATLTSNLFPFSIFVTNIIFMIGLALGIDYALFIIERFREERRDGRDKIEAIALSGDTASRAVLFSGLTVVISLAGMLIVPSNIFKSMGAGAIFVAIAAVAVALTLLPAVLSLLGDRVNLVSLRTAIVSLPYLIASSMVAFALVAVADAAIELPGWLAVMLLLGLVALGAALAGVATLTTVRALERHNWFGLSFFRTSSRDPEQGFWAGWSRFVQRNPWPGVIVATALLVALTIPYFGIKIGFGGSETFPKDTDAYRAFQVLNSQFSFGRSLPTQIVVEADDVTSPPVAQAIERLNATLQNDPAIEPNPSPDDGPSADKKLHLLTVALPGDAASDEALDALARLREEVIPGAFQGVDASVAVGGQTAGGQDFFDVVEEFTPIVFAFVLGLSFLLLLMVFRSLIVPLKAIVMNLLSVGAAYGAMVLVFQEGFLADALGFQQVESVEAWVPLFLFMILFGLSMDYHVFLLSRIRERYDETRDNAGSVAYGLRSTANIITGAAAIMIVVFTGFALGELVMFQQFGFGLAFAVFLDATVVRMVLVPSAMELLGDRNWYLPKWLTWLPDLRVEGGHAPSPMGAPIAGASDGEAGR